MNPEQHITVTAELTPVINYALYQNHIPVMRSVTVDNPREQALERVTLSVNSAPEIILPFSLTLDYIPAQNTFCVNEIELVLNVDYLANLTERVTGNLTLSLSDDSGEIASENLAITVLAFDEWQGIGVYPELLSSSPVRPTSSASGRATRPLTLTSRRTSTAFSHSQPLCTRRSKSCSLSIARLPQALRRAVSASV